MCSLWWLKGISSRPVKRDLDFPATVLGVIAHTKGLSDHCGKAWLVRVHALAAAGDFLTAYNEDLYFPAMVLGVITHTERLSDHCGKAWLVRIH
jgi:hypothetical protein